MAPPVRVEAGHPLLPAPANYYLLKTPSGLVAVDSGPPAGGPVDPRAARVEYVVLTHWHWDHSGGLTWAAGRAREVCAPPATLDMLERGGDALARMRETLEAAVGEVPPEAKALVSAMQEIYDSIARALESAGRVSELGDCTPIRGGHLDPMPCPGHSSDHHCYIAGPHAFVGDNVAAGSSVTLEDPLRYNESMMALLARADWREAHPGHGPGPLDRAAVASYASSTISGKARRMCAVLAAVARGAGTVREIHAAVYPALEGLAALIAYRSLRGYIETLERMGLLRVDRTARPWRVEPA